MQEIIKEIELLIKSKKITDIFLFGSRVYNTANKDSDFDFIVICGDCVNGQQFNNGKINITTYTKEHFQEKLYENKPFAVECFYLPEQYKILNKTNFKLILKNYREEYLRRILEDKKKLDKELKFDKKVKILFFISKLEKQLEWLESGKEFDFDLKILMVEIRDMVCQNGFEPLT